MMPTGDLQRPCDLVGCRHASALCVPQLCQSTRGDVEAAVALRMQRRGEIEQVRGFLVDLDRAACGDACEQAVAAVMRILAVKTVAFGAYRRKRGLRDGFRIGLQMQRAGTTHAGEIEFVYRV